MAQGFTPYYFKSKKMGEVDFVIERRIGDVLPIEVKSGKDYKRHLALNNIMEVKSYSIEEAYVFHNQNLSVDGKVCYLPVYMVACLNPGSWGER